MQDTKCPVTGDSCAAISKIASLERALDEEKADHVRAHSGIYGRLNELEKGLATVNAYYSSITTQLATISRDVNDIKSQPSKRWETIIAAILTGVVGFVLAKLQLS